MLYDNYFDFGFLIQHTWLRTGFYMLCFNQRRSLSGAPQETREHVTRESHDNRTCHILMWPRGTRLTLMIKYSRGNCIPWNVTLPPPQHKCAPKTSDISKEYPDYLNGNLLMKTTDVRTEATALGSGPTELSSIIYTLQNTLMSPNIHFIR